MLNLSLDVGVEKRQIVSGIGEKIVIIANLKPSKIIGIESQGILLAADTDQSPEPLEVSLAAIGAKIS